MDIFLDTVIRISPEEANICVEQTNDAGVTSRKSLSPETFAKCILGSRFDDQQHFSGMLPENCVATVIGDTAMWYYIRYPALCADVTYYGTLYEAFPLPRLVFGFRYDTQSRKITAAKLCVVKDERLTPGSKTYHYPFSNVYGDHNICLGNNALPSYKDATRISTLADFILRMPNNNDMFSENNNKQRLGYRDLLEHLKDKTSAYYYTDVLIPDGKALKDFMTGR